MAETADMHVLEHAAAFALDALEPTERTTVEAHLRVCRSCADVVSREQRIASLLGMAVDGASPRLGDVSRFRERLRAEHDIRRVPWRLSLRQTSLALAAAAVLVLAFGGWNLQLRQDLATQEQLARLVAAGNPHELSTNAFGGDVHGRAYVDASTYRVALTVSRLPQLASNRSYEIWFTRPDGMLVPGETFQVGDGGTAAILASVPGGLQAYVGVGVTDEPRGGSGTPSAPMLLYWVL